MLKRPRVGDRYLTTNGLYCPDFVYTIQGFNRKKSKVMGIVTCAKGKYVCDMPLFLLHVLKRTRPLMLSRGEKIPIPLGAKEDLSLWFAGLHKCENTMLHAYDRFVGILG